MIEVIGGVLVAAVALVLVPEGNRFSGIAPQIRPMVFFCSFTSASVCSAVGGLLNEYFREGEKYKGAAQS